MFLYFNFLLSLSIYLSVYVCFSLSDTFIDEWGPFLLLSTAIKYRLFPLFWNYANLYHLLPLLFPFIVYFKSHSLSYLLLLLLVFSGANFLSTLKLINQHFSLTIQFAMRPASFPVDVSVLCTKDHTRRHLKPTRFASWQSNAVIL